MRRILVDYARGHLAAKRGGEQQRISLEEISTVFESGQVDVLAVDEALTRLAAMDKLQAKIVELRFYGGLTVEETAKVLKVSTAKVKREWRMAQAWLHREISTE
jgi:RNA polymerase sigma factor (TIGR02999 family)